MANLTGIENTDEFKSGDMLFYRRPYSDKYSLVTVARTTKCFIFVKHSTDGAECKYRKDGTEVGDEFRCCLLFKKMEDPQPASEQVEEPGHPAPERLVVTDVLNHEHNGYEAIDPQGNRHIIPVKIYAIGSETYKAECKRTHKRFVYADVDTKAFTTAMEGIIRWQQNATEEVVVEDLEEETESPVYPAFYPQESEEECQCSSCHRQTKSQCIYCGRPSCHKCSWFWGPGLECVSCHQTRIQAQEAAPVSEIEIEDNSEIASVANDTTARGTICNDPDKYKYRVGARVRFAEGGVDPLNVLSRNIQDGRPEYEVQSKSLNIFYLREREIAPWPFVANSATERDTICSTSDPLNPDEALVVLLKEAQDAYSAISRVLDVLPRERSLLDDDVASSLESAQSALCRQIESLRFRISLDTYCNS